MKKLLLLLSLVFVYKAKSQAIFANMVGDTSKPTVIFLHGGPGYNSVSFELAISKTLSEKGFRVITYDQRGCGRSKMDTITKNYSFTKAIDDLNGIYKRFKVEKAFLIGHSWGGTLATMYARSYPEKVSKIIYVSSPVAYQETFKTVIATCKEKAKAKKDSIFLKQVLAIEKLDSNKLPYASSCFMLAMANKFYEPKNRTDAAKLLMEEMKENKKAQYLTMNNPAPVQGFYHNERYTKLDMEYFMKKAKEKGISIYGIYGDEDGLFDTKHLERVKNIVGPENYTLMKEASHFVFIDQREEFLKVLLMYLNKV